MKKKLILSLGLLMIIILAGIYAYFFVYTKHNVNLDNDKTTTYSCIYTINGDDFNNTKLEKYSYDITVNSSNTVTKSSAIIEQHYREYEDFYAAYSRLNTDDHSKGEIVAYDFDKYLLVFKKEETPNYAYNDYLSKNHLSNDLCKVKEEAKADVTTTNESDIKHLCTNGDNVVLLTASQDDGKLTSIKIGSKHHMNNLDEYEQRASVLKDNEYVSYMFDIDNLIITQLNTLSINESVSYYDYVNANLSDYNCEVID